MSEIVKKSLISTIINVLGIIIGGIVTIIIQAKYLTTNEVGEIALIVSKASFISILLNLGLNSCVTKYYVLFEKDKRLFGSFILITFLFPILAFLTIIIILYFIPNQIVKVKNYKEILFYALNMNFFSVLTAYINIKGKILFYTFLQVIFQKILYAIIIILYYKDIITFQYFIILFVLSITLNTILGSIQFFYNYRSNLTLNFSILKQTKIIKELSVYMLFVSLSTLSLYIIQELDILMLEYYSESSRLSGIYKIVMYIAAILLFIKNPLSKIMNPIISKSINENNISELGKIYYKTSINLLIPGILVYLIIIININSIFEIIPNGREYYEGKTVLYFLATAFLIEIATGFNHEILNFSKYYKYTLILIIVFSIVSITLNYILIPKYLLKGAAIATFISILLNNILRYYLIYRFFNIQPFNINTIKLLIISITIFVVFSMYSIENNYINIIVKSSLLSIIFIYLTYKLKLSEQINELIIKIIKKINIFTKN